ncbi:MAG TPA: histidine phosphatase family protein [Chromatiaceae bacterium]|jgi:broad specificity phosphatase PhoE|nr:MAG: hypothetical protein N838_34610 [Thiohalocapsa sp. PB-PSB1]QQO56672.1 MAG: histidine phosphatase family protein [Thiohalocapsa sp. PB-PSB1]HBG96068.1 histidine phosphatase family protein [Chromatiaceae bacterium]HCS89541.1 histidine phosphatase family protein [Chromatiaceae bacterium]
MRPLLLALICMIGIVLATAASSFGDNSAADPTNPWQALATGRHLALMRHAKAPGIGDPANFDVEDCATQRNLSARGRAQARAIGEHFRAQGIDRARVHSSQWCRCLETARLLDLGDVRISQSLNSFFRDDAARAERTSAALELIRNQSVDPSSDRKPLILVTHQVNITALTGLFPASGEIIVVKPNAKGLEVVGRIPPPS